MLLLLLLSVLIDFLFYDPSFHLFHTWLWHLCILYIRCVSDTCSTKGFVVLVSPVLLFTFTGECPRENKAFSNQV